MRRRRPFVAVEPPRVLVVENDPEAADLLLLRTAGCEAVVVADGALALEAAVAFQPNLVVSDLDLPNRDGYQSAADFQRHLALATVPMIAVSGRDDVGRATFGFASKYKKGATVPTGNTEFQFQAAKLDFRSDTYHWLVVARARSQYKGVGVFNGISGYRFKLTAVDGNLITKTGTPDRFRIKIWHRDQHGNDVIDYDNQTELAGAEGSNTEGTAIGGGSIQIHR